uniref:CFA20 domain-containing protein n=1 Tax=Chrysotila carterae TaxID=13221 RepID=A0A7S4B3I8_CHRCT
MHTYRLYCFANLHLFVAAPAQYIALVSLPSARLSFLSDFVLPSAPARVLALADVLYHAWCAQSTTRVKPFICTMPMRLDEGWNQIQFNLSDFTRRAYGTNYIETLRVQIHANCRIRRIYFSDRLYSEEELPPEFKLFLPIQKQAAAAGGAG